jgi:superfamily II DNA/RNA helicase
LQGLFAPRSDNQDNPEPLAIYLVPSRALAAEVESKLSRTFRPLGSARAITVTGLYGGTDWGPTDAWLTRNEPTVLICTYEKGEALLRFLGPLFLNRVSLVVIDEAHMVQFDKGDSALRKGENRSMRLEALGMRLLTLAEQSRVVALSAVAGQAESALAQWVTGQNDATPVKTSYRSTRQMVGRLECHPHRETKIRYDLMDGADLKFPKRRSSPEETLYIPQPFPPYPEPQKPLRQATANRLSTYLLWAAMNVAAEEQVQPSSVLIFASQDIHDYADDFLVLLEDWEQPGQQSLFALLGETSDHDETQLPRFFEPPPQGSRKRETWDRCLQSCEDYYTKDSREYRLLQKGIVVHHGSMPGLTSQLLVQVIEQRIARIVLATSTLSDGVNLPFEVILVPNLQRWNPDRRRHENMEPREFSNLVGRAGRPGNGTEGRTLVLFKPDSKEQKAYERLIKGLKQQNNDDATNADAQSSLARLLDLLYQKWRELTQLHDMSLFYTWLEQTQPLKEEANEAIETLDTLDGLLLAAIVEAEAVAQQELPPHEIEDRLRRLWQRSYARYASSHQTKYEQHFVLRGQAVKERVYSEPTQRARLYRTSIPPRHGQHLLNQYEHIRQHLETGSDYALWDDQQRFVYIRTAIQQVNDIAPFQIEGKHREPQEWQDRLAWWLRYRFDSNPPKKTQISDWHKFVRDNFGYRFNWGLGSIIALSVQEAFGADIRETKLEDWPQTGLPWIVLWLKELLIWGTLEPVAAMLLAYRIAWTRDRAESIARDYYANRPAEESANERLNATTIREWVTSLKNQEQPVSQQKPPEHIAVALQRDFGDAASQTWRVVPVRNDQALQWFDPAGFLLAVSQEPTGWRSGYLNDYDFILDPSERKVRSEKYLEPSG